MFCIIMFKKVLLYFSCKGTGLPAVCILHCFPSLTDKPALIYSDSIFPFQIRRKHLGT